MTAPRVRAVVGVGLAVIAAAVIVVLSQRAPRLAGTNSVRLAEYIAVVPSGGVICQDGEYIPKGAASVQIFTGTYGTSGALRLEARVGGRQERTAAANGFRDGRLAVPISPVTAALGGATICIRNVGSDRLALGGLQSGMDTAARIGKQVQRGRLGIEYLRSGRESWWQLVGVVADRAGDASATFLGRSILWIAGLLTLGAVIGAVGVLLRGERA